MPKHLDKRVILIVSADSDKQDRFKKIIEKHVPRATVYTATDGAAGHSKIKNVPPQVLITDYTLAKVNGADFIKSVLTDKEHQGIAIVISEALPEQEMFLDELVTGQIQFLGGTISEQEIVRRLFAALNFSSRTKKTEFNVKFLAQGNLLIAEGGKAEFVYIVRRGQLRAYKRIESKKVYLGDINVGEFVGEMAYVNGEVRSASVEATTDCELIEIPVGVLEEVLYKRPAWSKQLLVTLAKRLKQANEVTATKR